MSLVVRARRAEDASDARAQIALGALEWQWVRSRDEHMCVGWMDGMCMLRYERW